MFQLALTSRDTPQSDSQYSPHRTLCEVLHHTVQVSAQYGYEKNHFQSQCSACCLGEP